MNEEIFQAMIKGTIKWTLGIFATIGILGTIFWLFFYSVYTANLSFIIPVRNWYQDSFWNLEKNFTPVYPKPFNQIYTISVTNSDQPGSFVYSLLGKYSKIDAQNKLIYIDGQDKKNYILRIDNILDSDLGGNPVINVLEVASSDLSQVNFKSYLIQNSEIVSFPKNYIIRLEWVDNKNLIDITSNQTKGLPLNNGSPQISSIVVLKTN